MKRYILSLFLTCLTLTLEAVPALRIRRNVTLTDGRTVMVTSMGDEDFSFLLSDEGTIVLEQDSTFVDTGLTPEQYLSSLPALPKYTRRPVGSMASALVQPYGTKKIPVILTAFKDKKFSVAATDLKVHSFYDSFFNGTDISSTGNYGSVRQYFIDQSREQFSPEFTVIGPIELDNNYAYYGGDVSTNSKDSCYSKFVRESFSKALALENDWSQFDNNNDGKVDMCVIIFAGLGQNYTNNYGDKNTFVLAP